MPACRRCVPDGVRSPGRRPGPASCRERSVVPLAIAKARSQLWTGRSVVRGSATCHMPLLPALHPGLAGPVPRRCWLPVGRSPAWGATGSGMAIQPNPPAPAHPLHRQSCDLAQPAAIAVVTDTLTATRPPVDLLFNCAGAQPWHLTRTADGIETGLAPHFAQEPAALVLNMGSIVHRWARIDPGDLNCANQSFDPNAGYHRSKLALMLVSQALSRRLAPFGATVWAMELGMPARPSPATFRGFTG